MRGWVEWSQRYKGTFQYDVEGGSEETSSWFRIGVRDSKTRQLTRPWIQGEVDALTDGTSRVHIYHDEKTRLSLSEKFGVFLAHNYISAVIGAAFLVLWDWQMALILGLAGITAVIALMYEEPEHRLPDIEVVSGILRNPQLGGIHGYYPLKDPES